MRFLEVNRFEMEAASHRAVGPSFFILHHCQLSFNEQCLTLALHREKEGDSLMILFMFRYIK